MRRPFTIPIAVLSLGLISTTLGDAPGSLLKPGMQLIYSSGDQDQPPWFIDSVRADNSLRPGASCLVLHQRRQPGQAQPDESRLCLANDTLFSWNSERNEWRPQRPVRPGMVMEFTRPNGSKVRYEVGGTGQERVPGLAVDRVPVVFTTVTTMDSAGRPVRRLTELYAISLVTATGGEFEVADSSDADGWRSERRFRLREIRMP
jgi:hypothetical protein